MSESGPLPDHVSETSGGQRPVDLRGSSGVQIGEGNTQIIYSYGAVTVDDAVAPPPLTSVGGSVPSPYRGLASYREQDAAFYFGRENDVDKILAGLGTCAEAPYSLFVVSGLSGAGKTSLLRAGVIPRVRGAGLPTQPGAHEWPCLVLVPGARPLDELALKLAVLAGVPASGVRADLLDDPRAARVAAAQTGSRIVLVADQFERLFTACEDEQQRSAFLGCLAALTQGPPSAAIALVGVRADFEAICAEHDFLRDAVQHRYLTTAMTQRQLRQVITEPARVVGGSVEHELVETLMREVGDTQPGTSGRVETGALPLLSYAMDTSWRNRQGTTLTLTDYERTGGVQAALARTAEATFDSLGSEQRRLARLVFMRLVTVSSTTPDGSYVEVGQRVTRSELLSGLNKREQAQALEVVEKFAAERLLTVAADSVELCHDALLSAWPVVRDEWLAQTRADRIALGRLHAAAADWQAGDRDPSFLYGGLVLATVESAARRPTGAQMMTVIDSEFLAASRRRRRAASGLKRGAVVALAALAALLGVISVVAVRARSDAGQQRDQAIAHSLSTLSEAGGDRSAGLSKLESVAAWRIAPSTATFGSLLDAASRPGEETLETSGGAGVTTMSMDPHGAWVVGGTSTGHVDLWPMHGDRPMRTLWQSKGAITATAAARNLVAAADQDGQVRVWNVDTGALAMPEQSSGGRVTGIALSQRQRSVTSVDIAGTMTRYDLGSGRAAAIGDLGPDIWTLAASVDGKWLVAGGPNTPKVWVVNARLPRRRTAFRIHSTGSRSVALSGNLLLVGDTGGHIEAWGRKTHKYLGQLPGTATSMAFLPDQEHLLVGTGSGSVWVYDLGDTRQVCDLTGATSGVSSVAASPNGHTAVSAGTDGAVRVWNLQRCLPRSQVGMPSENGQSAVGFDADGKVVSQTSLGFNVQDPNGSTSHTIAHAVGRFALIPGTDVAAVNKGTQLDLMNLKTGKTSILGTGIGYPDAIQPSPDGRMVAAAYYPVHVVHHLHVTVTRLGTDPTSVSLQLPRDDADKDITGLSFSDDDQRLAVLWSDGRLELWNIALPTPVMVGSPVRPPSSDGSSDAETSTMVSFDDGRRLLVGDRSGTIREWQVSSNTIVPTTFVIPAGGAVMALAVDPRQRVVAAGLYNGTILMWSLADKNTIGQPLLFHTAWIGGLAFNKDGSELASTSGDALAVWDTSYLEDPAANICATSDHNVTSKQWTTATDTSNSLLTHACPD